MLKSLQTTKDKYRLQYLFSVHEYAIAISQAGSAGHQVTERQCQPGLRAHNQNCGRGPEPYIDRKNIKLNLHYVVKRLLVHFDD